jgi:hypothetical protein
MIETAKRLRRSGGARSSDRRGGRRPRAGLAPSEWWSPAGRSARRWRPLVLAVLRGTLLAERVGRARNVRQLHDRLVGILDRLRFFELVTWPVSTGRRSGCCRSAAVRSARRAGQSPAGCRSGKLEVVARVAPERSDEQDDGQGQNHPGADDNPLPAGGEHPEPVQKRAIEVASGFRPSVNVFPLRPLPGLQAENA